VAPHPDTFPPQKQDGGKKRSRGCCLILTLTLTLTVTDAQAVAIDRHWAQPQPEDKSGSRAVDRERAASGEEHGDKNMSSSKMVAYVHGEAQRTCSFFFCCDTPRPPNHDCGMGMGDPSSTKGNNDIRQQQRSTK